MRNIYIIGILSIISLCASCSTNRYSLKSSLRADESLMGKDHKEINRLMGRAGWNYTEHPNISLNDHPDATHCEVIFDKELGEYIFRFSIHANAAHLDGDRGKKEDRQRNEMKSLTAERWRHLNGNIGERQILKWKFAFRNDERKHTPVNEV